MNVASSSPSSRKQKRLGPAPIASMEDTSAEEKAQMEQQNHHNLQRWSHEKSSIDSSRGSPTKPYEGHSALIPATPRIDISRASSHSSHHDSRDSSPENVFEQVGTGTLQDSGVLGFREEDTLDLRNSTEELQFMEPEKGNREKEKPNTQINYGSCPTQRYSPIIWKLEEQPSQSQYQYQHQQQQQHNRKDSASSEVVAFLSISGRTSRLSSVGSQGSANSKLSATSAVSGISRSPSPHKMLLETSFCGAKPLQTYAESGVVGSSLEPSTEKMLEQVILSRKKDPTEAVLAEGVHVLSSAGIAGSALGNGHHRGEKENIPQQPPPGGGDVQTAAQQSTMMGHTRRKSDCGMSTANNLEIQNIKTNQTSRSVGNKRHIPPRDLKNSIVGVMPSGTEYIRIKLKPDHCYSDNGIADNERVVEKPKDSVQELSVASTHDQHRTRASSVTRSPSPANQQQHLPRKKRTSTASNESTTLGSRYDQTTDQPTASANSTPSKQKLVLKMFKSKRDPKSKSPSPMGSAADGIGQSFSNSPGYDQHTKSNIAAARSPGSTGLRYYDTPLDGQSIHIPLHTPPEERRLGSFRSAAGVTSSSFMEAAAAASGGSAFERQVSVSASGTPTGHGSSIQKHAKTPKQQRIANMTVTIHDRPKPMPPLKCYRIDNPDGSIIIPLKSPIEDKENNSHNWENVIGELSQRIEKHVSEDLDDGEKCSKAKSHSSTNNYVEPVNRKQEQRHGNQAMPPPPPPPPPPPASRSKVPKSPVPISTEIKETVDIELHRMQQMNQAPTSSVSVSMRKKQAALFQMRMGSGSEEQIFSTTLKDYTKEMNRNSSTVSQSSETSLQKAQCEQAHRGDSNNMLIDGSIVIGGEGTQTRKLLAGNCSEHPNDLVTAHSVTTSSSPQQVMQAQGAMLMKELHEHQKQHQLRQQQKLEQQQQQQHQQQLQQERKQKRDSYGSHKSAEAIDDEAAPIVSRSSTSPAECIDTKHHHHQHQHQNHHHQLHNHVHRQKHHDHDQTPSIERPGSSATVDDGMASSESEKDSEFDSASIQTGRHALRPNMLAIEDHESAGLVFQESFDDELPYIPTTLPEEKPVGIKLVPAKERTQIDLKTYPLERPRSTTPIHPGSLDKYCHDRSASAGVRGMTVRSTTGGDKQATLHDSTSTPKSSNVAKLRISLPVKKSSDGTGSGVGSRVFEHRSSLGAITMTTTTAGGNAGGSTSVAGSGSTGRQYRSTSTTTAMMSSMVISNRGIASEDSPTPPPLPPRKASASSSSANTVTPPGYKWIDVEAIPELRKAPKRITAIPQKPQQPLSQTRNANNDSAGYTNDRRETALDGQVYNYVNPEDCQCECHEHERTVANSSTSVGAHDDMMVSSVELADDCRPLLRSSSSSLTAAPAGTTPMLDECPTDRKVRPESVVPDNDG